MTRPCTTLTASVRALKPSATLAINERSQLLRAQGRDIFKLGLGQSPFPVPDRVRRSLEKHAGEKDYLPVRGLPALRHAIVRWHEMRDGIEGDAHRVIIGPGSKELLFILQLVHQSRLTNPAPSWVSYAPQAQILGKDVDWIDTSFEDSWRLTADSLDALCRKTPGEARLLILNYPNNPTGLSYPAEALEELAHVARRHGVVIISDEIYGEVHHDAAHRTIAEFYPEGTIISSGLSKWCGAGGWRLGYFHFPESLSPLADAMAAVASETFTSVSAPIQYAAVDAFKAHPEIERYLVDSRKILGALGGWITKRLSQAGLRVHRPDGGFYIFPDFQPMGGRLKGRGISTSAELTEAILNETGVAFLPGSCFGRPAHELTARISFVDFDGAKALEAMGERNPSTPLTDDDVHELCSPTVMAIERLSQWCESLS